jgi:alpha-L-fucosidase
LPAETNTAPSEVCDTIQPAQRWFWDKNARLENLQSADEITHRLRLCNARHANYLLNVPPDRDGLISGPQLDRLREVGRLLGKE